MGILTLGLFFSLLTSLRDFRIDNIEAVTIISIAVGAIVLIPLAYGNLVNPVGVYLWFALIVLLSMPIRWLFLTRLVSEGPIFILLHKDLTAFVPGALVASLGILCVVMGYVLAGKPRLISSKTIIRLGEVDERRFAIVLTVAVLISLMAIAYYLKQTGFSLVDLSSISAKRGVSSGADVDGYTRRLCDLIYILTIIAASFSASASGPTARYLKRLAWITASAAIFWAIASSVRAGLIFVAISVTAVYVQTRRREFPVVPLIVAVLLANLAFTFISSARKGNTEASDIAEGFIEFRGLESIAVTGNLGGTIFTQHMLDLVPGTINYQAGSTFTYLFIAPIPRSIWPGKPQALGAFLEDYLGVQAETRRGGGMATGLVGEIIVNFGLLGIVPIMLIFGVLLRWIENSVSPLATQSPSAIALQQIFAISLVYSLYGYNLARGGVDLIFSLAAFLIICWLASNRRAHKMGSQFNRNTIFTQRLS